VAARIDNQGVNTDSGILFPGRILAKCVETYGCVETKADVVDERVVPEKGVKVRFAAFLTDRPRWRWHRKG
jgi:hypothetical protein